MSTYDFTNQGMVMVLESQQALHLGSKITKTLIKEIKPRRKFQVNYQFATLLETLSHHLRKSFEVRHQIKL